MNKILVGTVIAGATAVALGAGSLVVTDRQIDKMVEQLRVSASAPMTVEIAKDDGNLLSRQLDLIITMQENDVVATLIVKNAIQKRPWGTTIVHAISMDSPFAESQGNAKVVALFNQYFVDQAFITGTTNVSFTGHYQTVLNSIAAREQTDDGDIDVKPMHVDIIGDMAGGIDMQGQWPGMTVTTNDLETVTFSLSPIIFSATGEMYQNSFFLGEQRIAGEGLSLSQNSDWSNINFALGAFTLFSDGRFVDDRFSGQATMKVASLGFNSVDGRLQVDNVQAAVSIAGIAVESYKAIVAGLNEMQVTGAPSVQLMDEANVLLRNGFVLEFSDWQAVVDDQNIAFNAMFELPENTVADVNNLFSLIGLFASVKANAALHFDAGLSDVPLLYDAVFGLLSSGAVVNNGDDYSMSFTLENGVATLNGEPLSLPF